MEITINNKQYKLKYTLRALFIFEQITGKMFSIKTLTDEYIFFYSILLANNKEMELTFDEFISALDEEPNLMLQYQNFIKDEMEKQNQFNHNKDSDSKKKL